MRRLLILFSLLIIFATSVWYKFQFIETKNTDGYANMLTFMRAWEQQGVLHCYASPTCTFQNSGDKFVQYWRGVIDKKGNCYYTSFPPFSFLITYFLLKLFFLPINKIGLLLINLLLHFLVAFFSGKIIFDLFKKQNEKAAIVGGFTTVLFILFTPLSFHFFSEYFFIENPAFVIWMVCTYAAVNYFLNKNRLQKRRPFIIYFIITLAFLCYTEAIGYMLGASFIAVVVLFERKSLDRKKLLTATFVVMILVLILTLFQYSLIDGWMPMLQNFKSRFVGRSGWFGESKSENAVSIFSIELYTSFWYWIKIGFLPLLLFVAAASVSMGVRKMTNEFSRIKWTAGVGVLMVMPWLLHTLIFINANALHEQLIVKIIFPLSLIAGILMAILFCQTKSRKIWRWYAIGGLCLAACIISEQSLFQFYPFQNEQMELAEKIKAEVKPQQTIVVITNQEQFYFAPNLFYFSERNSWMLKDSSELQSCLSKIKNTDCVIFKVDENWKIEKQFSK